MSSKATPTKPVRASSFSSRFCYERLRAQHRHDRKKNINTIKFSKFLLDFERQAGGVDLFSPFSQCPPSPRLHLALPYTFPPFPLSLRRHK